MSTEQMGGIDARCEGCDAPAVAEVMTGCVREHIFRAPVCAGHLVRARTLYAEDNLWCHECGPDGQRLRVRLRVSPAGGHP